MKLNLSKKQRRLYKFVTYAVLLVLQAILLRYLADKQVISTLFSAGARAHLGAASVAAGFVVLRLFIVLFMPGLVVIEALNAVLDRRRAD